MSNATVNQSLSQHLRMALSEYAGLPEPGETWKVSETDLNPRKINGMSERGVIEVVDRDGKYATWRTNASAWSEIQRRREAFGLLPCGHRPFSTVNLEADEPYACLGDGCDARYSRAEIEAVIDDA